MNEWVAGHRQVELAFYIVAGFLDDFKLKNKGSFYIFCY